MKCSKNWMWLLVILFCGVYANGQKKINSNKDVPPPRPIKVINSKKRTAQEPKVYYLTEVEINEKSEIKILIKPDSVYGNAEFLDLTESLFSTLSKKTSPREVASTFIIIKPNPLLRYEDVINVIKKIRKAMDKEDTEIYSSSKSHVLIRPLFEGTLSKILVEFSADLYAKVPNLPIKAESSSRKKTNPLKLVVEVDKNGKIFLNGKEHGTLANFSSLKSALQSIYDDRKDNGVYLEGTNEVDMSLFIKAPLSVTHSDVIKLVEATRISGIYTPILQIDDLQP